MPLIQVKVIENVFIPAQKSQIITKLTDALVSIEGENMRPVTLVVIEETRSGDWAVGGSSAEQPDNAPVVSYRMPEGADSNLPDSRSEGGTC